LDLVYLRIWVLGSEHRSAEKSIAWDEDFPYFANADVLIINTSSLDIKYRSTESSKFSGNTRKKLSDMLMVSTKKIIVILGGSVNWLPIYPVFGKEEGVEINEANVVNLFQEYYKNVKKSDYYIKQYNSVFFRNFAENLPHTRLPRASSITRHTLYSTNSVRNVGNYVVGCSVTCRFDTRKGTLSGAYVYDPAHQSGEITFLPTPSEISPEEGIELILNELLGVEPSELPPEWVDQVKLPKQDDMESNIQSTNEEIQKLSEKISELTETKKELTKYRKLLWTKGKALEKIVFDAFQLLGFEDIRMERTEELEDGIFDFLSSADYEHGILEVKGADNRTSLANLTQCNKWVEDYLLDDKKVKGVFIPNQHRLAEYPDSESDRKHFEPNEFEYAETRNICILPSCDLFNAVVEKLKENPAITRENLEKKILNAKGLCTLI